MYFYYILIVIFDIFIGKNKNKNIQSFTPTTLLMYNVQLLPAIDGIV